MVLQFAIDRGAFQLLKPYGVTVERNSDIGVAVSTNVNSKMYGIVSPTTSASHVAMMLVVGRKPYLRMPDMIEVVNMTIVIEVHTSYPHTLEQIQEIKFSINNRMPRIWHALEKKLILE